MCAFDEGLQLRHPPGQLGKDPFLPLLVADALGIAVGLLHLDDMRIEGVDGAARFQRGAHQAQLGCQVALNRLGGAAHDVAVNGEHRQAVQVQRQRAGRLQFRESGVELEVTGLLLREADAEEGALEPEVEKNGR
jgi:hypothetical protein